MDSIGSRIEPLSDIDMKWLDAYMRLQYTRRDTLVWAEKQIDRVRHAIKVNELENYVTIEFGELPF